MSSGTEAYDPSVAYDATPPQASLREEREFFPSLRAARGGEQEGARDTDPATS